jgi:oxygen-dependent protoporphyrinogen oxidase
VNLEPQPRRIAVIGGGIAGLAAANRLLEVNPTCAITLFEAADRLGGVISTLHRDGFQVERSSDNFITTVPWGLNLCKRLGLTGQLIQTNPAYRRTFVVHAGRLHRLPEGFLMMAPTRLWPLAVTPLLSPLGKLRAALEYFIPARKDPSDESMASFVRRRLGRQVFDRLVEPLVSAVYAADMEKLSLLATLPRFREMELNHGSLIRAMRRQKKLNPHAGAESGARYGMFVTLRDGLESLVDALAARLPAGSVRLNSPVERLERIADKWRVWIKNSPHPNPLPKGEGTSVDLPKREQASTLVPMLQRGNEGNSPHPNPIPKGEGTSVDLPKGEGTDDFDAVIIAAPSPMAAKLLAEIDSNLSAELATIKHSGTAIVSLGYKDSQIGHPLDGMGAVVPAIEQSPILAISFSSRKYAHRAPEGNTLLRIFVGGAMNAELAEMPDEQLLPLVRRHAEKLLHIQGDPVFYDIAHWPHTMPQYHVGHKNLIADIEAKVDLIPNIQLAGNAYHGVGIPDCIHGGELAAERILDSKPVAI